MDSLEDDEAADAEFLKTVREPKATAKILLANRARVDAMHAALQEKGLTFEGVVAEPLGAYALGAFMSGSTDLLTQPAKERKRPADFLRPALNARRKSSRGAPELRRSSLLSSSGAEGFRGRVGSVGSSGKIEALPNIKKEKDAFDELVKSPLFRQYLQLKMYALNVAVDLDSFDLLRPLGKGAMGMVEAVRKRDTGRIYALKKIKKEVVLKKNAVSAVCREKDILRLMNSARFVSGLAYAFHTDKDGSTGFMNCGDLGFSNATSGNHNQMGDDSMGGIQGACFLVLPLLLARRNVSPERSREHCNAPLHATHSYCSNRMRYGTGSGISHCRAVCASCGSLIDRAARSSTTSSTAPA